mmetsp:Transcript_10684/g.27407  ORF Transcript_10684/g.27407 Transcript_10684/m.27407 type:complete len:224 (-) Transcript_10684:525-1196(-)
MANSVINSTCCASPPRAKPLELASFARASGKASYSGEARLRGTKSRSGSRSSRQRYDTLSFFMPAYGSRPCPAMRRARSANFFRLLCFLRGLCCPRPSASSRFTSRLRSTSKLESPNSFATSSDAGPTARPTASSSSSSSMSLPLSSSLELLSATSPPYWKPTAPRLGGKAGVSAGMLGRSVMPAAALAAERAEARSATFCRSASRMPCSSASRFCMRGIRSR